MTAAAVAAAAATAATVVLHIASRACKYVNTRGALANFTAERKCLGNELCGDHPQNYIDQVVPIAEIF